MRFSDLHIVRSAKMLRGNAKTMMPVEPMFSVSWALLQFYMGLYMKSLGLTAQQMGYIISIQALSSIFFSFFGGYLTNRFGRRKTLLVTDLIAYPGVVLLWFFSDRFEMFALAALVQGLNVVVNVAWTCFLVEDINTEERIAAYNFINGLNTCSGIFVPISGFVVGKLGTITGQRTILGVAFFVMVGRILLRNYFGKETEIGKRILEENKQKKSVKGPKRASGSTLQTLRVIFGDRKLFFSMCTSIMLQVYSANAAMTTSSLYYVTFLTEKLGIGESQVSFVGSVSSFFMLISFLFVTPASIHKPIRRVIFRNVSFVILAVIGIITLGRVNPMFIFLFISLYALGYQGMQPMINTLMTDASKNYDMPRILSLLATITSSITAISGTVTGFIYERNPFILYIISIMLLVMLILSMLVATSTKTSHGGKK